MRLNDEDELYSYQQILRLLDKNWKSYKAWMLIIVCALTMASCVPSSTFQPGGIIDTSIASTGCGKPAPIIAGSSANETIISGGLRRMYRLHLPMGYRASSGQAVVLNFHGHSSSALEQEHRTGLSKLADQQDFIAVYPQGMIGPDGHTGWATGPLVDPQVNDVLFVSDLLNHLQATLCIDPHRIYATGFSNGGGMTNLLACEMADRIAAFAPVSGAYHLLPGGCHPQRPAPILELHGTSDYIVPYSGSKKKDLPPIAQWLQGWAKRDGCTTGPTLFFKETNVTGEEWTGCREDAMVVHYRIQGEGHMWPRTIFKAHVDATTLIWSFFKTHPLHGT